MKRFGLCAAKVPDNGASADVLVITAGEACFVLRAANHQVIGTSELYASKQMRDKCIEAVKAAAPTAVVVDRR
jgi:uncharacterized protein YegP (UPF0339 family)